MNARVRLVLACLPLFGFLLLPALSAQTITFTGGTSAIGGGFSAPNGVAVDGSGNVYVADTKNLAVKQIPANCLSSDCVVTLGGNFAFVGPQNVAVDSNGNVYVVDWKSPSGHVYEMSPNCATSSCVTELAGGYLTHPYAVAVDGSGNVYVANNPLLPRNLNGIFEMPPNCFSSTCVSLLQGSNTDARGLAVDKSGNIYATSPGADKVYEMAAGCSSSSCTITTLGAGFTYAQPYGVAVDGSGNVFVTSSFWGNLYELPPGCTSASCVTTLNAGYSDSGVAAAAPGKVYYADVTNNRIEQVQLGSLNFPATAVGSSSSPIALWFFFPAGVAPSNAGTTASAFIQGAPNLDFTTNGSPDCVGLAAGGYVCEFDVTFAPTAPGQRNGALVVSDSGGNVLATANIYGTGVGPQIAFQPGVQSTLGRGFSLPEGVAVDASGNVYVADFSNRSVYEILAVNGAIPANPTINVLGSGFEYPAAVAVDGSGNVYVGDLGDGNVKEILAVNGSIPALNPTINVLGSGFVSPAGLAVDGSGNVYVADYYNTNIYEILAVNGSIPANPTINILGSGFGATYGLAVDASGNVYVADYSNSQVKEIVAVNGSIPATNPTINILGSGFSYPSSVAVDASGDVYVADSNNSQVKQIVAVNGSIPASPAINVLGSGFNLPWSVALDARGNIYVADQARSQIEEINVATPPSLSFASTALGSTSTDSPQSVSIQNIGNALLTGSGLLSDATDFTQASGSGTPPDCTLTAISLNPGAACNLGLDFTPKSIGPLSASLTLSDNSLNANPATHSISLAGTGLTPPTPPQARFSSTLLQFATVAYSGAKTLPLTITNIGGGTLTVSTSITGPSYSISSSNCSAGVPAGNSCTLQVTFSPTSVGTHNDFLNFQTNEPSSPLVRLDGVGSGVTASSTTLQFGTIPFGTTQVIALTLTNTGVTGTVTFGTAISGPSYKILTTPQNTCLAGITAGQSCILPVEFSPAGFGVHNDSLTLTPSGGAAAFTVKLDGVADGLAVSSTTLNFGTIPYGTTQVLSLTVTNMGIPGTVTVGTTVTGPSYKILTAQNTCLAGISAGQSCTLPVEFVPTAIGTHNDFLHLTFGTSGPTTVVRLNGTAD